jgi:Cu/Ag efflux protein CusF
MFRTKSGLRKIAAIISITAALSITAPAAAQAAAAAPGDRHVKTETFIRSAFNGYKTLAGFSGDYGIALEMILQRSAAGESLAQLGTPVSYLLGKTAVTGGTTTRMGYLFNTDSVKTLKPGLAGKFVFTSQAVGAPTEGLQWMILKDLKRCISSTGSIAGATNDLDYAWVLLALRAFGETEQAEIVTKKIIQLQNSDGGFSSYGTASAVDASALMLQALSLNKYDGTEKQNSARANAINKAFGYVKASDTLNKKITYSDGNFDVNSTGYAAMAFDALADGMREGTGKTAVKRLQNSYASQLAAQVSDGGGFEVYWAVGAGDVMATSQAYAGMLFKNYIELLND